MTARIIECDSCGEEKPHQAHGWCDPCWKRWIYFGRPDSGPPPRRTGRWEEYAELTREHGYSLKNAAARMGISERTAQRHEARLRAEGVPLINETSRLGVLATQVAPMPQHTRGARMSVRYGRAVA